MINLTFVDEIAILKNSQLIDGDPACHMVGQFATKCVESGNFWSGFNRSDIFCNVFIRFATEMQTRLRSNCELVSHDIEF